MSLMGVVYCNLCPVKELCPYSDVDNAYCWSRGKHAKDREEQDNFYGKANYASLKRTTTMCPMRNIFKIKEDSG